MGIGTIGDTYVDQMLGEYVPIRESNGLLEEALTDESDQLLYALLVELRAARFARGDYDLQSVVSRVGQADNGSVDVDATYLTESFTASELNSGSDWTEFDLDFVTDEIDLRFDADINVVFQSDFGSDDVVQYEAADSPVVGVPASTSWIYVSAQAGTGGADIKLEAWGGN